MRKSILLIIIIVFIHVTLIAQSSLLDGTTFYSPKKNDNSTGFESPEKIEATCKTILEKYNWIDVNNIKAGFNASGYFFNKLGYDSGNPNAIEWERAFEVPKGSNKYTIFGSSLWIGGLDENWQLHLAAEKYRQSGIDFWAGPVSDVYDSIYDLNWNRIWKINKWEIIHHIEHWQDLGYVPIEQILSWPGNGNVEYGQSEQLAPYFDGNGNDAYEPLLGDYPLIRGDQALFFIYNDDRDIHTGSLGEKMGMEIHAMAYGFDDPADSVLSNSIFLHLDIINRSENNYDSCFAGLFTDFDIGNPDNDFIASDVARGSFYAYNGFPEDPDYIMDGDTILGYGNLPPAQSITFMGGPFMNPDNLDNPSGGCDESINGLNFGDDIIDNERLGMTNFITF